MENCSGEFINGLLIALPLVMLVIGIFSYLLYRSSLVKCKKCGSTRWTQIQFGYKRIFTCDKCGSKRKESGFD